MRYTKKKSLSLEWRSWGSTVAPLPWPWGRWSESVFLVTMFWMIFLSCRNKHNYVMIKIPGTYRENFLLPSRHTIPIPRSIQGGDPGLGSRDFSSQPEQFSLWENSLRISAFTAKGGSLGLVWHRRVFGDQKRITYRFPKELEIWCKLNPGANWVGYFQQYFDVLMSAGIKKSWAISISDSTTVTVPSMSLTPWGRASQATFSSST